MHVVTGFAAAVRAPRKSVESRTGAGALDALGRAGPVSRPRSSNRTCGFPASGSRTRFFPKACTSRKLGGGTIDAHGVVDVRVGIDTPRDCPLLCL